MSYRYSLAVEDLPEPGVIAGEILERLAMAMGELRSLQDLLARE